MFFPAVASSSPGLVGPDPVASPGDVPSELLLRLPAIMPGTSVSPVSAHLVLDAPAAESVTVDLYVLDEATDVDQTQDDPTAALASRRFYLWDSAVTLTGGTVTAITVAGVAAVLGSVYVRPTADTLAADRTIRGSVA
jgi:hypothetical protein